MKLPVDAIESNANGNPSDVPMEAAPDAPDKRPSLKEQQQTHLKDDIFGKCVKSDVFQNLTLFIIVLNAFWIGMDVEWNNPKIKDAQCDKRIAELQAVNIVMKKEDCDIDMPWHPVDTIVENIFCTYFSVELLIRFLAYARKLDMFKDNWFMFDGTLVFFMVLETWVLAIIAAIMGGGGGGILSKFSALRLLRLLRLTRMARLMTFFPELLTLVKGMLTATKAVFWVLLFLLLCMYVFAIVFTSQLGDSNAPEHKFSVWADDPTAQELFGSLGDSMMSLFTRGMLADNLAQTLIAIKDHGGDLVDPACMDDAAAAGYEGSFDGYCSREGGSLMLNWAFIIFMIISAFCLLNMLIGVLCEVIQDSAEKENESTQINELRHHMAEAFDHIDTSKDGLISTGEWDKMKLEKTVRASMASLGVEEQHMEERLDQMKESLFGGFCDEGYDADCALKKQREGLTFDEFIEKVVEIRPDMPASAIDIEILRVRVEREEKGVNERLDFIEQALTNVNAFADGSSESYQATHKTEEKIDSSEPWLRDVPTEVLFAVLNSRAPPELGPPKLLAETR